MKTPYDFGAIGDGIVDDTAAIQAWLNVSGYGAPGCYAIYGQLLIRSDTHIRGHSCTLLGAGPLAQVINERCSADIEAGPLDNSISLQGITFERILVALCGVTGLLVRDCLFHGQQYDGLQLCNNRNMRIDSNEFRNWGKTTHDTPGSGTYVGGSAIFCWRPCWSSWVTNNWVHDGAGGIWLPVENIAQPMPHEASCIVCTGNIVERTTEFGLVTSPELSVVIGNITCDTELVDVSGNGSENHGRRFAYGHNVHARAKNSGSWFGNSDTVAINGNVYADCGGASIQVSSVDPSTGMGPNPPRNIVVHGNAGGQIAFGSLDGRKVSNAIVTGNVATVDVPAGVKGRKFIVKDNL